MANVVVVANQIQLPQEDQWELVRLPRFVFCQINIFSQGKLLVLIEI